MTESSSTQRSDPNADWARAIAEMTAAPEAEAADVAQRDGKVGSPDEAAPNLTTADGNTDDSFPAKGPRPAAAGAAGRSRTVLASVLGVATIIFGSLGIWAAVAAHNLRAAAANANAALVDQAATRSVEHAVSSAVNTIFSYSYADTGRTKAAAQQLLTGPASRQYNQLFALVQQQAPKEKLVVTTRVTDIGVELLSGGRSRLLVFANEEDSKAGTTQATYGGAMFAVTAVDQHGRWRIESIDTFTGPA
jgi:Mce-associated membrane protein